MALKVRTLIAEEAYELKRLAGSRTAPHRLVRHAQIIGANAQGETASGIARQVRLSALRVRAWIHRFNGDALVGLADAPRCGRPRRHDKTARGTALALAYTTPCSVSLPFALWTLAWLRQALHERHWLRVTPAMIWKWLQAEGLVWGRQQSWFQVTVDSAFVEKRGPSSKPTRSRYRSAGSSASTRWAR
jgi:putative transposase